MIAGASRERDREDHAASQGRRDAAASGGAALARGVAMLTSAVESYLAVRRAAGFQLRVPEGLLRGFARLAADRGERHVVARTAIAWAAQAPSPYQRGRRLEIVTIFARQAQAEDARHEIPPAGVFPTRRQPFTP